MMGIKEKTLVCLIVAVLGSGSDLALGQILDLVWIAGSEGTGQGGSAWWV